MKRLTIPLLCLVSTLAACGSAPVQEKGGTVHAAAMPNLKQATTGKTKFEYSINYTNKPRLADLYAGDDDIYYLHQSGNNFYLKSIIKNAGDKDYCLEYGKIDCRLELVKKNKLYASVPTDSGEAILAGENVYATIHATVDSFAQSNWTPHLRTFYVEYRDYSQDYLNWRARYAALSEKDPDSYIRYAREFPHSPHMPVILREMFGKFYGLGIVGKDESEQRPMQGKEMLSSIAGSCKDISRRISIAPKAPQTLTNEFQVKVKYTLRRTYEPLVINDKDDPLYLTRVYRVGGGRGASVEDQVSFNCVLTSGRFHFAGLDMLAKVVGTSGGNGVQTTLTKIGFDAEILEVK